jgi:hypothetical protein
LFLARTRSCPRPIASFKQGNKHDTGMKPKEISGVRTMRTAINATQSQKGSYISL